MKNSRSYPRKIPRRVSFLLITFCIIAIVASRPVNKGPHPAVSNTGAYDTPGITIDPTIRDSFPFIYNLLQQLISEKKGIFQEPAFHEFFFDPTTRLVFSAKEFPKDTGALSFRAQFHEDGYFYDTIFLNRSLFEDVSREYLVSVIIHESMHAYLTWCSVCYAIDNREGVDERYLRNHIDTLWQWLTVKPYPNNDRQHILMTENFIKIMTRDLYLHTNPKLSPEDRDAVAQSLTWGGLNETPEWGRLGADTCRFRSIDIWSRNLNAGIKKDEAGLRTVVKLKGCRTTDKNFLDSLQLGSLDK